MIEPVAQQQEFITVGKLGRTRGIHGELYVTPFTDFPERFLDLKEIYVEYRGVWERRVIESSRLVSARPVIRFANVTNPEDAARLTNRNLAVTRDQVVKLPEDSFYIFDLVGCKVYEEDTSRYLGEVVDVRQYPANDAYVIRRETGDDVLFPVIRQYVKHIDIDQKKIVVDSAGLFDDR
jgi:16S rRNA processing protein RimM